MPKASTDLLPEIARFLEPFAPLLRRAQSRYSLECYVMGLFALTLDGDRVRSLSARWIVGENLLWLGRNRRMSKDYERLPETSEVFIYLAISRLMATRLARR